MNFKILIVMHDPISMYYSTNHILVRDENDHAHHNDTFAILE
jgi:hypothetical protein